MLIQVIVIYTFVSQSCIEKTEKNTSLTYIKWYAVVFIYAVVDNANLFLKGQIK